MEISFRFFAYTSKFLGTSGIAVNVTSPHDSEFMEKLEVNGVHVEPLPGTVLLAVALPPSMYIKADNYF
jgi:hypothetical protein